MKMLRLTSAVLFCAACSNMDTDGSANPPPGPPGPPPITSQPVSIRFKAKVGTADLDCTSEYHLGKGTMHLHAGDLRFYVHNLRLVTPAGVERPVALTPDQTWQSADVALLDFTDKSSECTGTPEINTIVKGTVDTDGTPFSGLRFTLGVPFAKNHQDVAQAAAPLNHSEMFWSWNGGYKFLLLEGHNHDDKDWIFHLGSTGCMKDANNQVTACNQPNRLEVSLPGFDPAAKTVVFDMGEALADENLDLEASCHSSAAEPDCAPFFGRIGLPLGTSMAMPTKVFRVE